jgi:hypothetical protein
MSMTPAISSRPAAPQAPVVSARPRDADGDNDGTRAKAATAATPAAPRLAPAGRPGSLIHLQA